MAHYAAEPTVGGKSRKTIGATWRPLRSRERTNRNPISVWISERELAGLSIRIHVSLLFKPADESACPLKRQIEIIDKEEQKEPLPGLRFSGLINEGCP